MKDDDKTRKPPWEKLVIRRVMQSTLIWAKPCSLFIASITAASAGPAAAVIRNGNNEDADKIFDLAAPASSMAHGRFQPPLFFSKGIFVEVGANVTSVLVQIRQEN